MYTDVQIINAGIGAIAGASITRLDPPDGSLARYLAASYPIWKRTELTKRRWVFATEEDYRLTLTLTASGARRPYRYLLPSDCLRPIRLKRTRWQQRGRYLASDETQLVIDYIKSVPEADFDPLFVDVLKWAIAFQSAEYITQSNAKRDWAYGMYEQAVDAAGKANAYVIGPEDYQSTDEVFTFVTSRWG